MKKSLQESTRGLLDFNQRKFHESRQCQVMMEEMFYKILAKAETTA